MVNEYTDIEKKYLDDTCSHLRVTTIGTHIQELQKKLNSNENIDLEYNNQTGILKILVDNVEKAYVNLGLEKYVNQASIVNDPQGQVPGKYIKLEFEGGANAVFIPTADIGKIYSAGTGININSDGIISCKLNLNNYYTKNEVYNKLEIDNFLNEFDIGDFSDKADKFDNITLKTSIFQINNGNLNSLVGKQIKNISNYNYTWEGHLVLFFENNNSHYAISIYTNQEIHVYDINNYNNSGDYGDNIDEIYSSWINCNLNDIELHFNDFDNEITNIQVYNNPIFNDDVEIEYITDTIIKNYNLIDVYNENKDKSFVKYLTNAEYEALETSESNTLYIVSDKKDFSYAINVYSNMNFWNSIQQNNWYSLLKDFPYEVFTKKELENMNFYLKGYNHDTHREEKYYFGKILLKNATNTYFLLFKPYYSFMFDPFTFEIEIGSEKRPEFTDGDNIQIFGDGINNISSPINVQTLTQMNFTLFKEMYHGYRHQFSYFTAQGWDLSTGIYSFSETRDISNKFFDVSINSVFTTIHNDLPVLNNKWVLAKTNFKYADKYYSFNEDIFNTTEISGDYSGGAYANLRTQISNNLPNFIDKVSFRGWSGESFNIRKIVYINNNVYSEKNILNQILTDLNTDDLETKIFYNP